MARLPRIDIEGALYYVTSRGVHEEAIFKADEDYHKYLELLDNYKTQYGFKLFAFVLLPHHLHLLIELKEGVSISAIMHDVTPTYTKYFNGRYGRKGHLFQGRFRAVLVEKEPYVARLTRYIHLNPERVGLVKELKDYPYSSYSLYISVKTPAGDDSMIPDLGAEIREVISNLKIAYEDFMRGATEDELKALRKGLRRGGSLGSKEFAARVRSQIASRRSGAAGRRLQVAGRRFGVRELVFASTVVSLCLLGVYFLKGKVDLDAERRITEQVALRKAESTERLNLLKERLEFGESDGTEWDIELTLISASGSDHKLRKDRIRFKDGKVSSSNLASSGYSASNYTVTVKEDGTVVWETTQRSPSGEIVFWRGETREGRMQGVLSQRPTQGKGKGRDFSFVSIRCRLKNG